MLNREQTAEKLIKDYQYMGSWDAVAEYYGLSKALVYRTALKGYEPKNPHIRLAMDMCTLVPTPVCQKCGEVPLAKHHRCNGKPPRHPRHPRLAIRLDDPHSAARSILKHMPPDQLSELIELLK